MELSDATSPLVPPCLAQPPSGHVPRLWLSCGGGGGLIVAHHGRGRGDHQYDRRELDPDGYTLTLDDVEVRPIGTAASAILAELSPGEHRIGLSGIAPNCTVQDGNPRTVTVTVGETAVEDITVLCAAAPRPPPAAST